MRGISSGVFIFIFVMLLVEILGYLGMIRLIREKRRKQQMSILYWLLTAVFLSFWLTAFLDPEKIRRTSDYGFFYFIFFISTLNFLPKAVFSVFVIIAGMFRLFRDKTYSKIILLSGLILS